MYRTIAQLDSAMQTLAAFFPQMCTRVELPNRSIEGRPIYALRMRAGGGGGNRRGVLIVGGMHARELMNPDAIVELQFDLVLSYLNETGRSYGGAQWSALDIKVMLETLDIWFLTCANPDGRNEVMRPGGDRMWRKNRRVNRNTTCKGVDLNRNSDFLYGVTGPATSCSPCTETYLGRIPISVVGTGGPFSEPESRNIEYLTENFQINVFVDVHSFSNFVLHPWGHAPVQTNDPDPSKRFPALPSMTCQPLSPTGHREYMAPRDLTRYRTVASRIRDTIKTVQNSNYLVKSIYEVYNGTTTGTCSDYVYSRHIASTSSQKTYGFAFETGPSTSNYLLSFQPIDPAPVKRDAKAGLISLLQQSVCAIDFIGSELLGISVQGIRDIRDDKLSATEAGREWIEMVNRVQFELLGIVLSNKALTRKAASLMKRVVAIVALREKASVSDDDVKRAVAFLDDLKSRAKTRQTRDDLSKVLQQL